MRRILLAMALVPVTLPASAVVAQRDAKLRPGAAARVGSHVIPKKQVRRWLRPVLAQGGNPRRGTRRFRMSRRQTMQFLIQSAWVQLEARVQRIAVSPRKVKRDFRRQKRQAFGNERAYRRWFRRQKFTHGQLIYRVRIDILQTRLTQRALAGVPDDEYEQALDRYVHDFRSRWRARTTCRRRYAVRECGERVS